MGPRHFGHFHPFFLDNILFFFPSFYSFFFGGRGRVSPESATDFLAGALIAPCIYTPLDSPQCPLNNVCRFPKCFRILDVGEMQNNFCIADPGLPHGTFIRWYLNCPGILAVEVYRNRFLPCIFVSGIHLLN